MAHDREHNDPHQLSRFVQAQENRYQQALTELERGRKDSHWMWFIFPQLSGLGSSPQAKRYGISDLTEAEAYAHHPILGPRLLTCCDAVLAVTGRSAHDIFGAIDAMKLRSCATLFALVSSHGSSFHRLLDVYFQGDPDPKTLELLGLEAG